MSESDIIGDSIGNEDMSPLEVEVARTELDRLRGALKDIANGHADTNFWQASASDGAGRVRLSRRKMMETARAALRDATV